MALTEEQIKNLKPGDPLIIHGTFKEIDNEGDIWVKRKFSDTYYWVDHTAVSLPSEHGTSVPTPKYDPTRLFRKGDKVRIRKVNGNLPKCRYNGVTVEDGTIGEINSSDERNCYWVKFNRTTSWCFDCAYFELVTPVEELEPFTVVHKQALQHFQINHGKLNYMTFPYGLHKSNGWYHTITTAKAAAEAECKRLNEEWRKEHK